MTFGDFLSTTLGTWRIDSLDWDIPILGLLLYLGIQAFLIFLYLITSVIMKNRSKKLRKFSPDLLNGIRFMIRIGIVVLSASAFIVFLMVPPNTIWLIAGVLTAAIVFASVKTINNFIAGVWIMMSHPYGVGDYIMIRDVEGIVTEISLNYTKILHKSNNITSIPNLECLKSNIVNFTIDIDYYQRKIDRLTDLISQEDPDDKIHKDMTAELEELQQIKVEYNKIQDRLKASKKDKSLPKPSRFVRKNKIIRYTFTLSLDKNPKKNAQLLDDLCRKYQEKFKFTPDWKIIGLRYKIDYMFVIITPNPEDIIEFYDDFVWDIYKMMNEK